MEGCFDRNKLKMIDCGIIGSYIMIAVIFLPMLVILITSIQESDIKMSVTAIVLMAVLAAETFMIIMLRNRATRVRRYATIFDEDHDGIITFKRISEMTGYSDERIKRDIKWLFRGDFIHNVIVEEDRIRLKTEDGINEVICPNCGGVNMIRSDSSDYCEYCGSYLRRD